MNALWGHLSTSSANEAEAFKKSQDRSKLLHPTKPMIEQLNYHWQKEDAAAQERSLAAQGFSVDGERLKESRKIVGLPRAPAIDMHPSLRKGPGTGAPPQNQRRAAGAGASAPAAAWGTINLDHYAPPRIIKAQELDLSQREPRRRERVGNAGSPRASSAGERAPAVPARKMLSPRLPSASPSPGKERARLNPGPKFLARSTPAALAAQLGSKHTKQASSGEQASADEKEEEEQEEDEKEDQEDEAEEGAPDEPGDSQGERSPAEENEEEPDWPEAGDQDQEEMLSPKVTPPKSEEELEHHGTATRGGRPMGDRAG